MQEALHRAGITADYLAERHKSLLDKREVVIVRDGKESHHELTDQPDTSAVSKGLDLAYKVNRDLSQGVQLENPDGKPIETVFIRAEEAKKLTQSEKQALRNENA